MARGVCLWLPISSFPSHTSAKEQGRRMQVQERQPPLLRVLCWTTFRLPPLLGSVLLSLDVPRKEIALLCRLCWV